MEMMVVEFVFIYIAKDIFAASIIQYHEYTIIYFQTFCIICLIYILDIYLDFCVFFKYYLISSMLSLVTKYTSLEAIFLCDYNCESF